MTILSATITKLQKIKKLVSFPLLEEVDAALKSLIQKIKKLNYLRRKILFHYLNLEPQFILFTVFNNNENKKVTGITYDSHDEMVLQKF